MSRLPLSHTVETPKQDRFTDQQVKNAFLQYCNDHYSDDLNYHLFEWSLDKEYDVIDIVFGTTEKGLPVQPRSDRSQEMTLCPSYIKKVNK